MKKVFLSALLLALLLPVASLLASGAGEGAAAPSSAEPYTFRMFASFRQQQMSETDKAMFAEAEKANNVKIVWETPPSSSYAERLQLMLAGGNYPEVVLFDSTGDRIYLDAVNNGVVIGVSKYLKYMPYFTKYSYKESWDSFKVKGDSEIYGLPRTSIARADGYYVRKDWLANLKLTIPEGAPIGFAEFNDLLKSFTKGDPDGNGKADTWGFGPSTDAAGNMGPILGATFGMVGWQKYEGEDYTYMNLQFSRKRDNYKRTLAHTAGLWKDGLIDPDWPVVKGEQAIQRFKQGVTGVQGAFAGWTFQYVTDMRKINEKVDLTYITAVKSPEGKQVGAGAFGTGTWGVWAVTSSVKDKDAQKLFSTIDWFLSDAGWEVTKYGPEGLMYTKQGSTRVPTDKYSTDVWIRNMFRRNNDPEFFIPLNIPPEMQPTIKGWLQACIDQAQFSLDKGFRPAAADDPKFIDYGKTLSQAISKIVTGAQPVDSWDAVLDGWYKAGGEAYIKQMNEFIAKTNK